MTIINGIVASAEDKRAIALHIAEHGKDNLTITKILGVTIITTQF